MRQQLQSYESHSRVETMKLFMKNLEVEEAAAMTEERKAVAQMDKLFHSELRSKTSSYLDDMSKDMDVLLHSLFEIGSSSIEEQAKQCRQTTTLESLQMKIDLIRKRKGEAITAKFKALKLNLAIQKEKLDAMEGSYAADVDDLYGSFERSSAEKAMRSYQKIVALFGGDVGQKYKEEHDRKARQRMKNKAAENQERAAAAVATHEEQAASLAKAEGRLRGMLAEHEKSMKYSAMELYLTQLGHEVAELRATKKEELLVDEANYYQYLLITTTPTQATVVLKECDQMLSGLQLRIQQSVAEEMDCAIDDIPLVRQKCSQEIQQRLSSARLDLVLKKGDLEVHAKAYSTKMEKDAQAKVQEIIDSFATDFKRIRIVYGDEAAQLFDKQARQKAHGLAEWAARRRKTIAQLAVERDASYENDARLNMLKRMKQQLREYRQRIEDFALTSFMREKVTELRVMHEDTEKVMLQAEAKQDKVHMAQATREASILGQMCASGMCNLTHIIQTSVVAETSTPLSDIAAVQQQRRDKVDAYFQSMEADLRKRKSRLQAQAKSSYEAIKKKMRLRVAQYSSNNLREVERTGLLYGGEAGEQYTAMVRKAIESLMVWASDREDAVIRHTRQKLDGVLMETYKLVEAKMRSELEKFEDRCRLDVMALYLSQVRHAEELEAAELIKKFLVDEAAYYQYLQATNANKESNEALHGAKLAEQSEVIMYELTEFIQRSVVEETKVDITGIAPIRQRRIEASEKYFERFRDVVSQATEANKKLESQARAYLRKLRGEHVQRSKQLRDSSKTMYQKVVALFGSAAGTQYMEARRKELQALISWASQREKYVWALAAQENQTLVDTACEVEARMRKQLGNIERRARGDAQRVFMNSLQQEQEALAAEAARLLLMAEAAHLERLARNATNEATSIAEYNERTMSELTEMIQASVVEETKVDVDQIAEVRRKRDQKIEERFAQIETEVATKKAQLEDEAQVYAEALKLEASFRVKSLEKKAEACYDKICTLFGPDVGQNFLKLSKQIVTEQIERKYEHEKDVLSLLHEVLKGCTITRELRSKGRGNVLGPLVGGSPSTIRDRIS